MKFFQLIKSIPALFADLANAVFAVHIAAFVVPTEIAWWHYIIAIPLAMLPDLDAIPELLNRGKLAASAEHQNDHRELLHIPIAFLVVGVLFWLYFGYWGALFLVATMLHFVNDMYGTGWGIPLLRPLTRDRFKLFTDANNEMSFQLNSWVRRIKISELQQEIVEHGNENWIEDYYWKLSTVSLIEYALFVFALYLMLTTLL